MRFIPGIIVLLLFAQTLPAQHAVSGEYHDYAGSRLILRSDSTFYYHHQYITHNFWSTGSWSLRKDTLRLKSVPVYDTMLVHCRKGYVDSLLFSVDTKAERIPYCPTCFRFQITYQDTEFWPDRFFVKEELLFAIAPSGILYPKKEGMWSRIDRSKRPKAEASIPALVTGTYMNNFGSKININADSTFNYSWRGHMAYRWAAGTWTTNRDTIYFQPFAYVDTIGKYDVRDLAYDSLFLAEGDTMQRFDSKVPNGYGGGWQSPEMVPYKLWISKDRLYLVLPDGEIDKVKRDDGFPGRRSLRYTYFTRS